MHNILNRNQARLIEVTSVGKSKEKTNKPEEIYIPPEKRQQIIDDLKLF